MSILVLTSDTLIGTPATGNIEYSGQFYGTDSNASRAQMQRITQGTAVASTSGTSITFSSLPSWVKRITMMFNGVSTSGTVNYLVQIGSGSVTSTGYVSGTTVVSMAASNTTSGVSSTAGFIIASVNAANVYSGIFTLINQSGNVWVANYVLSTTAGGNQVVQGAGILSTLGGALDRVVLTTTNGTDTFDAGSINILYEG
jgi:hypothetical protein